MTYDTTTLPTFTYIYTCVHICSSFNLKLAPREAGTQQNNSTIISIRKSPEWKCVCIYILIYIKKHEQAATFLCDFCHHVRLALLCFAKTDSLVLLVLVDDANRFRDPAGRKKRHQRLHGRFGRDVHRLSCCCGFCCIILCLSSRSPWFNNPVYLSSRLLCCERHPEYLTSRLLCYDICTLEYHDAFQHVFTSTARASERDRKRKACNMCGN